MRFQKATNYSSTSSSYGYGSSFYKKIIVGVVKLSHKKRIGGSKLVGPEGSFAYEILI